MVWSSLVPRQAETLFNHRLHLGISDVEMGHGDTSTVGNPWVLHGKIAGKHMWWIPPDFPSPGQSTSMDGGRWIKSM